MRRYHLNDLQGGGFCEWSHDEPATRAEIIEHFDTFRRDEGLAIPKKALTLRNIALIWGIQIKKV